MLILKCSACKKKIWRYDKIGQGEVLRCHKDRIKKVFQFRVKENKIECSCGKTLGIDKGSYYKMVLKSFTYSGSKRND